MHAAATLLAILVAAPAAAGEAPAVPFFVEETASAGIDSVYQGDWQYMVGGGAAAFDCSGDGFPDLFLAGGEGSAAFFRNTGSRGGPLRFARQASGLELDRISGAYPLDVDGDGFTDLALLRVGESVLMRGLGGCRFERANERWGFDGGDAWATAFAATWERGNTWPTLAVGTYIDREEEDFPWGSCTDNRLHRPDPSGRRFGSPLALKPSFCALSMLFTDWNRSGTPSLRVSNDREYYKGGQEQLWHVEPGKAPALYTADEGWKPLRIWGMGIAAADLDADGYPEYFLTSMADNKLQMLAAPGPQAKPAYGDLAFARGVTAHRPYAGGDVRPSTAWHAQFEDVNNDGFADLFVAKGNVDAMPDFAEKDPNNLLLQDAQGGFHEAGEQAGVDSFRNSRGAALADFNLDGLVDLVVVNRREGAQIWRNQGTAQAGRWIEVKLAQPGANRDAVGARIEVRRGPSILRRDVAVGGGHAGGQLGWLHVGLGDSGQAELRVVWPDGTEGAWETVETDCFYLLERGKAAQAWTPPR